MTLESLKSVVDNAIKTTIDYIQKYPISVLTEGDFERILSCKIEEHLKITDEAELNSYMVHNQVSLYSDSDPRRQIDIVLMDNNQIEKCNKHHKGYFYDSCYLSIAVELKYYRKGDDTKTIKNDLEKSKYLLANGGTPSCFLYVVALTEEENPNQKETIEKYFSQYKDCKYLITDIYHK